MSTDALSRFAEALAAHDVTHSSTTSEAFRETLESAIREPVVGASLPVDGIELPPDVVTAPTSGELHEATTGVTAATLGIAEYGSVLIESRPGGDEPISLYPERHVAVLRRSDLVDGIGEALTAFGDTLREDRGSAVLTTGPSATGDMGAMVQGVHGPHEVHVIVLEDR